MINTKTVTQIAVQIADCKTAQDLRDKIQAAVGNVDIAFFQVIGQYHVLLFIEVLPSANLLTFSLDTATIGMNYTLIHVVEGIMKENPGRYTGDVQEVFAEKGVRDVDVIMSERDPQLQELMEERIDLSLIESYDGNIAILRGNDEIQIIPGHFNVAIDYGSYDTSNGTVKLMFRDAPLSESYQKTKDILAKEAKWFDQYSEQFSAESKVVNSKLKEDLEMVREGSTSLADDLLSQTSLGIFFDESKDEPMSTEEEEALSAALSDLEQYFLMSEGLGLNTDLTVDDVLNDPAAQPWHEDINKAVDIDKEKSNKKPSEFENLLTALDAIENDQPYELPKRTVYLNNERERNVQAMKELLQGVYEVSGDSTKLADAANGRGNSIEIESNGDVTVTATETLLIVAPEVKIETNDPDLAAMSIGDTVTEVIKAQVTLISVTAFDEVAANHNILGWDLNSPTTLLIKYTDGVTSSAQIAKFHEMMDNLDAGWVDQTKDAVTYFTEFHKVVERDLEEEFISRVRKHNVFVRDSLAKIRSALIDMERDHAILKDEITLTIDWDKMTAHAVKKERIETRTKGVEHYKDKSMANLVKVNTGLEGGDFFIPFDVLTDEMRSKYVLDNQEYFIEDAPSFAFYEVLVNGHVMIIEKTDL